MVLVEGVEEERERVAGPEDRKGPLAVLVGGRRRRGGLLLRLFLCFLSLPFIHPPEFRPALGASAAGVVVAAGKEGAVRELDGKRAVFMRPRERIHREGVEGPALPGPGAPDADVVLREPADEVDDGALLRQ